MYAVVQIGKHQYKAEVGQVIAVEHISAEEGSEIKFTNVLAVSDGTALKTASNAAAVLGIVEEHRKDDKVLVLKRKPRKKYRKVQGHRQLHTNIKITKIEG